MTAASAAVSYLEVRQLAAAFPSVPSPPFSFFMQGAGGRASILPEFGSITRKATCPGIMSTLSSLDATFTNHLRYMLQTKDLRSCLNPLDATPTQNKGWGP